MILLTILEKLHVIVINVLAIFITVATFGLIGYAISRDKLILLIHKIISKIIGR